MLYLLPYFYVTLVMLCLPPVSSRQDGGGDAPFIRKGNTSPETTQVTSPYDSLVKTGSLAARKFGEMSIQLARPCSGQ